MDAARGRDRAFGARAGGFGPAADDPVLAAASPPLPAGSGAASSLDEAIPVVLPLMPDDRRGRPVVAGEPRDGLAFYLVPSHTAFLCGDGQRRTPRRRRRSADRRGGKRG